MEKKRATITIVTIIALILFIFLLLGTPKAKAEWTVLDRSGNEIGKMVVPVTLPLDENETCEVAKSAANLTGQSDFECFRVERGLFGNNESGKWMVSSKPFSPPIGISGFAYFEIDENSLTVREGLVT